MNWQNEASDKIIKNEIFIPLYTTKQVLSDGTIATS